MNQAISGEPNQKTLTNLTYLEMVEKMKNDRANAKPKSPTKLAADSVATADKIEEAELSDKEDDPENHQDEASTDASGESDSGMSEQQELDRKQLLFAGSGNFIKHWNNFVILLAMYNAVLIPLQLFYDVKGHSAIRGEAISFIDACVDLFFLVDIVITFRTTFLDPKQSIEVKDPHAIGKRYLRGGFTIDLISSVPFSSLIKTNSGVLTYLLDALGLLKLLRLTRLYSVVQRSNLPQDIKVYLKVVMMAIFLLVFIHLLSCIWFAIVSNQERWVQNMDFMYYAMPDAYQSFHEGDEAFWRKYFVLLYTGFYVFGVGEIVPRAGTFEFLSAFILCSLCMIFNAVIIGYMTSYMEELNKKTAELSEKLNLTNTAMLNLNLSRNLKQQITQYIYQTHTTKQLQSELTNFMTQISPIYKRKVTKESFKDLVKRNTTLKEIKKQFMEMKRATIPRTWKPARRKAYEQRESDKCITSLVVKLESIFTSPDMIYMQQEDPAWQNPKKQTDEDGVVLNNTEESFMYFIRNGKFSVHVKTENLRPVATEEENQASPVTNLIDGDHFGEIGMLF